MNAQLSLFFSDSAELTVMAPRPCRCGSIKATLESSRGPHAGELRCRDCSAHMAWASHAFVAEFRRPGFVTGISSREPGCAP
jgi:hypothetical protein